MPRVSKNPLHLPSSRSTRPALKQTINKDLITLKSSQGLKDSNARLNEEESNENDIKRKAYMSEFERFIEISKYFSDPMRKTASYICENQLVAHPTTFRMQYIPGGFRTQHIRFTNLTLQPVYLKLFKLTPFVEAIKFTNLAASRCKRIPPGLSFDLGCVYDAVNGNPPCKATVIFVASRKTITPCYQICEIELNIAYRMCKMCTESRGFGYAVVGK